MSKAALRVAKELKGSRSFEPNRLSDQCLATAYELAFPVVQQDTTRKRIKETVNSKMPELKTRKVGNLGG